MQAVLGVPRTEYSREFALFVTEPAGSPTQQSYRSGIIFVMCLVAAIWFIWTLILLYFKCNGKYVGCAAGKAFEPMQSMKTADEEDDIPNDDIDSEPSSISGASASFEEGMVTLEDTQPQQSKDEGDEGASYEEGGASFHSAVQFGSAYDGEDEYTLQEYQQQQRQPQKSDKGLNHDDSSTLADTRPSPRARRTRLCFLLFSLVTLACVPCVIIFTFKPLIAAQEESDIYVAESRDIIENVNIVIDEILEINSNSSVILDNLPMNLTTICPNVTMEELESELAINLGSMVDLVASNYMEIASKVVREISDIRAALRYYEDSVELVESTYDALAPTFWVVPTILFTLSAITAAAASGVLMAWKEQSTRGFQRLLSLTILPTLISLSLACWVIAIVSGAASAVGTDACLSGSSFVSPSETLSEILLAENLEVSSPVYKYVSDYTTTCAENDPSVLILELEGTAEDVADDVWRAVGRIDAVGQLNIDFYCNGGSKLNAFVAGTRELVMLLSASQGPLGRAASYLECEKINALFLSAVNDSICTDTVGAAAWSFVLFLCLGVSTMVMITLRASWIQRIAEDKIYDESEVAENMFVDEHEEYLAYISKYKHEWEEYQGLNVALATEPPNPGSTDSLEQSSSSQSNDSDSHASGPISEVASSVAEAFDPYNSSTDTNSLISASASVDNISFLSLNVNSPQTEQSPTASTDPLIIPSPLLQVRSQTENDADGELLANDLISGGDGKTEKPTPSKSKYNMVPSPKSSPSSSKSRSKSFRSIHTTDPDDLLQRLDEIGSPIVSTLGTPVCLSEPPTFKSVRPSRMNNSPASVEFKVRDDTPSSKVKQQVDNFSKGTRVSRPATPPRLQGQTIKNLKDKFSSAPSK